MAHLNGVGGELRPEKLEVFEGKLLRPQGREMLASFLLTILATVGFAWLLRAAPVPSPKVACVLLSAGLGIWASAKGSRPQDTPPPVRIVLGGRDHRRIIRENVTNVRVPAGAAGQSLRKGGGVGPIPSVPVIRSPLVARKRHPSRACSARRSVSRAL